MNNLITLIIVSLATFRITRLITTDLIFSSARIWMLMRFPNDDEIYTWNTRNHGKSWWKSDGFIGRTIDQGWRKPTFIGRLISCDYCLSVWLAPVLYALYLHAPAIVLVAAIAGLVYLLASATTEGDL